MLSVEEIEVATAKFDAVIRARSKKSVEKIAVVMAGAIPYFAHRYSIDLLGKSDTFIARTKPKPDPTLQPGHTKWDYPYSMGKLEPDVITRVWHPEEKDFELLKRLGYEQLENSLWVKQRSARIDHSQITRRF